MVPAASVPAPGANRVTELLESLRAEFESVSQDASLFKYHKDEYEQRVVNNQIKELTTMQQSVMELERMYQSIKQQYEEEIYRLRRELEARGGPPAPQGPFLAPQGTPSQAGLSMPGLNVGSSRSGQGIQGQSGGSIGGMHGGMGPANSTQHTETVSTPGSHGVSGPHVGGGAVHGGYSGGPPVGYGGQLGGVRGGRRGPEAETPPMTLQPIGGVGRGS
ncbi:General transcriptional corepressor tupA, partial [Zancudomyces culisetae]